MTTMERTMDLIKAFILAENDEERNEIVHELSTMKEEQSNVPDDHLQIIVEDLLSDLGIPCHILGHDYIVTAVIAIIEDERMKKMTKVLYPHVARVHDTTSSRVERAIRHAVEVGFDRCDADKLYHYFGNTVSCNKGKPTNSEFLSCVTKEVRRQEGDMKRKKGA